MSKRYGKKKHVRGHRCCVCGHIQKPDEQDNHLDGQSYCNICFKTIAILGGKAEFLKRQSPKSANEESK